MLRSAREASLDRNTEDLCQPILLQVCASGATMRGASPRQDATDARGVDVVVYAAYFSKPSSTPYR